MNRSRPPLPVLALLAALVLLTAGAIAVTAGAADPSKGTVSLDSLSASWDGKHYEAGATIAGGTSCSLPGDELCDHFDLTVDIDPAHWETYNGGVEVVIAWQNPDNDFDLRVYDANGKLVGSSLSANTTGERVFIEDASGRYQIRVNPYTVVDEGYSGSARVESRADVGDGGGGDIPTEPLSGAACTDGLAGPFPCRNVDLESFLPLSSIGGGQLNDIWGWTDPETGREYALVGKTSGTAFVDITNAQAPVYLGDLPSHQPVETFFNVWRDVKVYENHAYVVSEEPLHGMQVFDLTRLRGVTEPREWSEDAHYAAFGNAHNVAINEESGFAYAIGTSTCSGGPHIVDIREPQAPKPAGCVFEDGYSHDTQCVNYDGPDERYSGREICFSSNEDTLTIVDVTDKLAPKQLSRTPYDSATYTHQGWLTPDGSHFLLNDELDEQDDGENTRTYIFNVESLTHPGLAGIYTAAVEAIDHNLYTKGSLVYEANYRSGLRILDTSAVREGTLTELGFFDVFPADDRAEFNGAWSNYPYYESGVVAVSGIEQGLFVLRPTGDAAGATAPAGPGSGSRSAGRGRSDAAPGRTRPRR